MRNYIYYGAAAAILGVGFAVYFIFFTGTAQVAVAPTGSTSLPVAGQQNTPVTDTTPAIPTAPISTPNTPVVVSARLVQISKGPVVPGESVVSKAGSASSSPETTITYIERESGNVFSYLTHAKTLTRISNKTIPGIQSAAWLPNASTTFVRYLSGTNFSTINTYALSSNGSGGFFLPQNLTDIAVASTSILTLASGVNGSSASLMRIDGTHPSEVFTTPLSALRVGFAGKNTYLAFTKPTAALSGSAFLVDSAGRFSRIAGPLDGLVALASPSGKWVLVSYFLSTAMQMELVNAITGEAIALPVATIADKCVWTTDDSAIYCGIPMDPPAGFAYPDDWYQGAVHFSDRIWKIQVSGRYAQLVLDFSKETQESLDATALAIDSSNTTLVFVNKNDSSLWTYSL